MFHPFRHAQRPVAYGRLVALLALALLPLTGLFAATAAAPAPQIGVVDLDATAKSFVGYKSAMTRMEAFAKERDESFTTLKSGVGLNQKDYAEYLDLAAHTVKINSARIKELEDLAKKTRDEFQALKDKDDKKETLTADERARFEQLDKDIKVVSASLNEQGDKLYKEVQDEYNRYSKILTDLVDKTIGTVAAAQKVSIVLSKNVQGKDTVEKLVLWGGTDITNDVVKALNDNFKESMLDVPAKK